jgi:hypothetical protein
VIFLHTEVTQYPYGFGVGHTRAADFPATGYSRPIHREMFGSASTDGLGLDLAEYNIGNVIHPVGFKNRLFTVFCLSMDRIHLAPLIFEL